MTQKGQQVVVPDYSLLVEMMRSAVSTSEHVIYKELESSISFFHSPAHHHLFSKSLVLDKA
jgi:hypothetical protein